jgi:hypothetical protein
VNFRGKKMNSFLLKFRETSSQEKNGSVLSFGTQTHTDVKNEVSDADNNLVGFGTKTMTKTIEPPSDTDPFRSGYGIIPRRMSFGRRNQCC